MRMKSRVLIVAAVAAALFGAGPAFASDDSPAGSDTSSPTVPVEAPDPADGGPIEAEKPDADPWENPSALPEEEADEPSPGSPDPDDAAPSTPIEEEPNYTG